MTRLRAAFKWLASKLVIGPTGFLQEAMCVTSAALFNIALAGEGAWGINVAGLDFLLLVAMFGNWRYRTDWFGLSADHIRNLDEHIETQRKLEDALNYIRNGHATRKVVDQ